MKNIQNFFCISLICLLLISCANDDNNVEITNNNTTIADDIFTLVNQHRQSIGLSVLTRNETADQLSTEHTQYMISIAQINHDNFDQRGTILGDQENATGMAENVAQFYPDAQSVVNGWLESSGHRQNIEGNYTHTGISAIKDSKGRYYYTQLFYR
ncbi:CAP domain-containing protein [Aquimarina sp. RZ0]|uniref:CAP domain-containing protein n=1 Tax=Aquimarina sp. RZ0 TaxID=2607730 RepID=UPI0011F19EF9|nr:CAP domain-containing protein [Aquimarina sp. RZ0]KAA1243222.1 CAP domain-containing protein [Aquimarina sp. RZ0]